MSRNAPVNAFKKFNAKKQGASFVRAIRKLKILFDCINLFAEQDKHLSKVNTTTQIVVQARLLLMKKKTKSSSDHIT